MNHPNPSIWQALTEAQRAQVVAILAQILLRQLTKKEVEDEQPYERVQAAVRLLFERFQLSGKISHVVRYFHEQKLEFPKRKGGWDGPLQWGPLSCQRVRAALDNPLYAGAYVYGRVTHRPAAKPPDKRHQRAVRLPPHQWAVTLWDCFPQLHQPDRI